MKLNSPGQGLLSPQSREKAALRQNADEFLETIGNGSQRSHRNQEKVCLFVCLYCEQSVGRSGDQSIKVKRKKAYIMVLHLHTYAPYVRVHTHTHTQSWVDLAQDSVFFQVSSQVISCHGMAGFVSSSSPVNRRSFYFLASLCLCGPLTV